MTPADRLITKVRRMADKVGISEMLIVVQDPDSRSCLWHERGNIPWIVGALEIKKAAWVRDAIEQEPKEGD